MPLEEHVRLLTRVKKAARMLRSSGFSEKSPAPIAIARRYDGVGHKTMKMLQKQGLVAEGVYPHLSPQGTNLLIDLQLSNRAEVIASIERGDLKPTGSFRGTQWRRRWLPYFAEVFEWAGKGDLVPALPEALYPSRNNYRQAWNALTQKEKKAVVRRLLKSADAADCIAGRMLQEHVVYPTV